MNLRPVTSIPDWTPDGVLPPINPFSPTSVDRSPYNVSLIDFITHFGINPQRLKILSGFLTFRALWHTAGITHGFQWIDGSYIENIEALENRTPADVDVVTFFRRPSGLSQIELADQAPQLFQTSSHQEIKTQFHIDHYPVSLEMLPENLVHQTSYWYSVWAHRRNHQWKGFLEIDLSPTLDSDATVILRVLSEGIK
jgi:hypothetical protein